MHGCPRYSDHLRIRRLYSIMRLLDRQLQPDSHRTLEHFWAWWWPTLASWLAKTWQPIFLRARHPIEVIWEDDGTGLADRTDLAKAYAIILLSCSHALVRELRLTTTAGRELRNVCRGARLFRRPVEGSVRTSLK